MAATVSGARWPARTGVKACATAARTSAEITSADLDRGGNVGAAVIVIVDRVLHADRAEREHHGEVEFEMLRQPDVGKGLAHRHRRAQLVDAHEPLRGQEIE